MTLMGIDTCDKCGRTCQEANAVTGVLRDVPAYLANGLKQIIEEPDEFAYSEELEMAVCFTCAIEAEKGEG